MQGRETEPSEEGRKDVGDVCHRKKGSPQILLEICTEILASK
jgi:hypothetical protein